MKIMISLLHLEVQKIIEIIYGIHYCCVTCYNKREHKINWVVAMD